MTELPTFAAFCDRYLRLEDGRPLILEPFQRRILANYFSDTTETIVLIPKNNGKSTLVGALALFHLVTTPDAEGCDVKVGQCGELNASRPSLSLAAPCRWHGAHGMEGKRDGQPAQPSPPRPDSAVAAGREVLVVIRA